MLNLLSLILILDCDICTLKVNLLLEWVTVYFYVSLSGKALFKWQCKYFTNHSKISGYFFHHFMQFFLHVKRKFINEPYGNISRSNQNRKQTSWETWSEIHIMTLISWLHSFARVCVEQKSEGLRVETWVKQVLRF